MILNDKLKPRYYVIILLVFLSLMIFSKLIYNGLPNFDDCYYAQKAKEVYNTGDIWIMKFNNKPEFENTPMHMWLLAISYKIFGITEFAARFSSALFTILLIWIVFLIGKLLSNEWLGAMSSFVLSTTLFLTKYSLRAMTDITLSFFIMLSILFFLMGLKKNQNYFFLSGIMTGCAILTKSIFGAYLLFIYCLYLLIERKFKILFSFKFILSGLLAVAIASPWYIINYIQYKETFIKYHFIWIIKNQAFTDKVQKWTHYLGSLKVIFSYGLPWVPIAIYGSYRLIKERLKKKEYSSWLIFILFTWLLVILLSFADHRKSWHLLPACVSASVISGYLLNQWVKNKRLFSRFFLGIYVSVIILIVILPIDINSRKSNELKKVVPIIKKIVPEGEEVLNYRQGYWGNVCSFLFYTDRHLTQPILKIQSVIDKLKTTHTLALTHRVDFKNYVSSHSDKLRIIGYYGKYVLFCHKEKLNKILPLFVIPKDKKKLI